MISMEAGLSCILTRSIARILIPPHPGQHFAIICFLYDSLILTRMRWNLHVVSIYIFPLTKDVDIFHVFIGHLYLIFYNK